MWHNWETNSTEQSPSRQLVKTFSTFCGTRRSSPFSQSAPRVPILSQINPVHTSTSYFLKIHFNSILSSTPFSSDWYLFLVFPPRKRCMHLSRIRATCPAHLILDLITGIIFREEYRSWRNSHFALIHSPVPSTRSGSGIVLKTLCDYMCYKNSTFVEIFVSA